MVALVVLMKTIESTRSIRPLTDAVVLFSLVVVAAVVVIETFLVHSKRGDVVVAPVVSQPREYHHHHPDPVRNSARVDVCRGPRFDHSSCNNNDE